MRIVLDTASFVTAVRSSEGAAREILGMILRREIVALMDLKLGLEYRDVALRSNRLDASEMTGPEVLGLIQVLESIAEFVEIGARTRPLSPDPNDDMILDLALTGKADAVSTMNKKHFGAAGKRYGFDVLTPSEFLETFRKRNKMATEVEKRVVATFPLRLMPSVKRIARHTRKRRASHSINSSMLPWPRNWLISNTKNGSEIANSPPMNGSRGH
jgi:putative PIN family toxin of toxin-antitoxin system